MMIHARALPAGIGYYETCESYFLVILEIIIQD